MATGDINTVTAKLAETSVLEKTELSFAGKGLKLDSDADAREIVDAITSCKNLYSLELKGNTLGVQASKAVGAALEQQSNFKRALWSDLFTGRLKTEIPDALRFLCGGLMTAQACLVELDLSDNAFGPNGMTGLTDFLKSSSCYTLRELRLNNNGLGITGGKMLAESLLACYTASVDAGSPLALEVFVSGRGRLEDEGATALAQAFKAMKSLVEVHMPQNGINHRGITALAEAFAFNTNLRHINLSDNTFTEKGSVSMAKALPSLSDLEVINFDDCLVRTTGAIAIAKALAGNNHKLKVLRLSGNEITKDGAEAVVGAVTSKSNFEQLDLNSNQLGEGGVDNVKRLMKSANMSDRLLTLSDDEGSEEEEEEEDNGSGEENNNSDEEENAVDNESGEEAVPDSGLEIVGQALKSLSLPAKSTRLEEFLSSPSAEKLRQIGANGASELDDYLGGTIGQSEVTVPIFMKISDVVRDADEETKAIAFDLADVLLSRAFGESEAEMTTSVLCNAVLAHLGLIKSEDKTFRPPTNIEGPLIVLGHAARQTYFPQTAKDTLAFFVEQSMSNADQRLPARQQLLHALQGH